MSEPLIVQDQAAGHPVRSIVLDGELTIYRAAELRDMLLAALSAPDATQPPALAVDLSGVTEIDSAGVQLLLALRRDALAAGGSFAVPAASEAVAEVMTMLGLRDLMDNLNPAAHTRLPADGARA